MIGVRVTLDSAQAKAAFARAPSVVMGHVERALDRAAGEVAREARQRAPKWRSALTLGILHRRVDALDYEVRAGVSHARPTEEGVRGPLASQPGTKNGLMDWVRDKLRPPEAELARVTWRVARSLQRKGIRAQPFLGPAVEAKRSRVLDLVAAAVAAGHGEAMRG